MKINLFILYNSKVSYITNPLNQRVAKLVNGEIKEKNLWKDLTTLLAIYDKDNNLKSEGSGLNF